MEATTWYFGVILGQWRRKWKLLYRILGLHWDNGEENGSFFIVYQRNPTFNLETPPSSISTCLGFGPFGISGELRPTCDFLAPQTLKRLSTCFGFGI